MAIRSKSSGSGTSKLWMTYTPEYGGNHETDDPMTIEIHPLNAEEVEAYSRQIKVWDRRGYRGQKEDNALDIARKQFKENTQNIKNFFLDDREVTDVEEFARVAPWQLKQEIVDAMEDISRLTENEKKFAGSAHTSCPAVSPSGTATDARTLTQ